jgi:hypothetical protein
MYYLRRLVTGYGFSQQSIRRRSDTSKACEFQLYIDPRTLLPEGVTQIAATDQAQPPAAGAVFEPGELIEHLFIEQ